MVDTFVTDAKKGVETLRLACEPYMNQWPNRSELLLLYLLAVNVSDEAWTGQLFHSFSVRTRILCELKVAARYQVTPRLVNASEKGRGTQGKQVIGRGIAEVGFDPKGEAKEIAKSFAHHVFRKKIGEYDENDITNEDWEELCELLATSRKGINPEMTRYEVDQQVEENHPLANKDVRQELHKLLPDLPVVLFGAETQKDEKRLRAQVNQFYKVLKT